MTSESRVEWIVASNPGPLTLDGTRCYLVGSERLLLVDPGPSIPGHLERLERLVRGRPVEAVCLTHAHADHSGLATAAAERFRAPIAASAATLDRLGVGGSAVADGDWLPVDDEGALRCLTTPGHSADHTAFLLEPGRSVFTGNLVLGAGSSAVLHPDGEVGACLASFARVLSVRPGRLYPGHGPPVSDGQALLKHYRDHRLERHDQVARALAAGGRTVAELTRMVYGDLETELEGAARASLRAHLVYLREQGETVPRIAGLDDVIAIPEEA